MPIIWRTWNQRGQASMLISWYSTNLEYRIWSAWRMWNKAWRLLKLLSIDKIILDSDGLCDFTGRPAPLDRGPLSSTAESNSPANNARMSNYEKTKTDSSFFYVETKLIKHRILYKQNEHVIQAKRTDSESTLGVHIYFVVIAVVIITISSLHSLCMAQCKI